MACAGDSEQSRLATQVGWPAFKRARRLKWRPHGTSRDAKDEFECDANEMTPSGHSTETTATTTIISAHCEQRPQRIQTRTRHPTARGVLFCLLLVQLASRLQNDFAPSLRRQLTPQRTFISVAHASLIIGDSAIEIQEVDQLPSAQQDEQRQQQQQQQQQQQSQHQPQQLQQPDHQDVEQSQQKQERQHQQPVPGIILGSSSAQQGQHGERPFQGHDRALPSGSTQPAQVGAEMSRLPSGPLPPLSKPSEDVTDGDHKSRAHHDYDLNELGTREPESGALSDVLQAAAPEKTITGAVVDFELQLAGGHNKAKIKKKKKKKKEMAREEKAFKKWDKKKKMEKKAMEKEEKKHMKKKKEEGEKKKKKWGVDEHGQKKKGDFKKKKWGKKVKKGKGVKKGKKGKKFLKDKGHKNTGFKTVYHKEEWGKSNKWHDIKREKKWDEVSKKWKKKWKKEKGKKYKGEHMKKFEKKKKEGKKYKKAKKEKFKKFKKEEFEAGKKKKMEEHKKKKEGGAKKEEKELKKKKKKKKP